MSFARKLPIPETALLFANGSEPINADLVPRLPSSLPVVEYLEEDGEEVAHPAAPRGSHAVIVEKELLTSLDAVKPVYRFAFDAAGLNWQYEAGDSFDLYCSNPCSTVDELLTRCGIKPESVVSISNHPTYTFDRISVKQLFAEHVEISQFPKKAFLRHLAEFTEDLREKRCLLYLSSRLGSSEYLALAQQCACLVDFLATFPSTKPTLECLLQHLPHLFPRSYSLISSPLDDAKTVEFIASMTTFETGEPDKRTRFGVCSGYLNDIVQVGDKISVKPRDQVSFFKLPKDSQRPLLFICAGTAIAPFIGFLRHRQLLSEPLGQCVLYYGFRSRSADYLFKEELEHYRKSGNLTRLRCATSREEPKQYVQDVMLEDEDFLYEFIMDEKSLIYLCGDEMTMIKGVNDALLSILNAKLNNLSEAQDLLKRWTSEKKILRDIWL